VRHVTRDVWTLTDGKIHGRQKVRGVAPPDDYTSHVTSHTSHVTRHTSRVTPDNRSEAIAQNIHNLQPLPSVIPSTYVTTIQFHLQHLSSLVDGVESACKEEERRCAILRPV